MATAIGDLVVKIRADSRNLSSGLRTAEMRIHRAATFIVGAVSAISGATSVIAAFGIRTAASLEQAQISFKTMLGSAIDAKQTIAGLVDFAARTPFELPGIIDAARGLILFGERGDEMMRTLTMLGNASAATGADFAELALIYNQIRGAGKLLQQDFRQLAIRGVLSQQDLADHFKVSIAEIEEMRRVGKISFADIRDIMFKLSEDGGRFGRMMEQQAQTLSGVWSTMRDDFRLMSASLLKHVMPETKEMVKQASQAFTWVRETFGAKEEVATLAEQMQLMTQRANEADKALREAMRSASERANQASRQWQIARANMDVQAMDTLWQGPSEIAANYRKVAEEQRNIVLGVKDWQQAIIDIQKRSGAGYLTSGVREMIAAAREAEAWTSKAGAMEWMKDTEEKILQMRLGLDDFAMSFRKIAMAPGLSEDQLRRLDEMYKMYRQASKKSEQNNLAEQLKKQYEGPEQKIKQYQELLRAGKIDQKIFDSAVADLQKGQGGPRYAGAAERGSREAYSILMNSRRDNGTKKLVQIAGKQLVETQGLRRDLNKQDKVSIPST
jgi:hypothetical protein